MAAGHRLEDLKRHYTIAQVELFARALAWNRQQEKLDRAEAVALGIMAAFNPEEQLLHKLRQSLIDPQPAAPEAGLKQEVMAALFGSVPVVEK